MKRTIIFLALVLIFILLLSAPVARVETPGPEPNEFSFWRLYRGMDTLGGPNTPLYFTRRGVVVKLNLVKIQDTSSAETWIFNMDIKRFWYIRYAFETFSEGSFEELRKYYQKRADEERSRIEGQKLSLSSLDEKNRAERSKLIEQRLNFLSIGSQRLKVEPVKGDILTIAGYQVKPIRVKLGEDLIKTFWTTDQAPMPEGWRRFLTIMSEIDPTTWKAEAALPNLAIKEDFFYGGFQRGFEAQSLTFGSASASEFLIPTNFAKIDFNRL